MKLPYLDADFLHRALDYPSAVAALHAGYAGESHVPERLQMDAGQGRMWLMPAQAAAIQANSASRFAEGALGVKIVTQFDGNAARGLDRVQGTYIYMDAETGQPLALLDGRVITEFRTAAVSALATTLLANSGSVTLAIFGTGVQAAAHLAAMRAIRGVLDAMVSGATPEKSRAFAEAHGCRAASPEECCQANLICACSTARSPLWDGAWLRAGTHINAVGNSRPDSRELDAATVMRSRVAVDTREGALAETGDLLLPIAAGEITREHILAELAEIVRGTRIRQNRADITLFKSVGFGLGDLVIARLAYAKWVAA